MSAVSSATAGSGSACATSAASFTVALIFAIDLLESRLVGMAVVDQPLHDHVDGIVFVANLADLFLGPVFSGSDMEWPR